MRGWKRGRGQVDVRMAGNFGGKCSNSVVVLIASLSRFCSSTRTQGVALAAMPPRKRARNQKSAGEGESKKISTFFKPEEKTTGQKRLLLIQILSADFQNPSPR